MGTSDLLITNWIFICEQSFKHMLSNDLQHYSALLDIHIDTLIWLLIATSRSTYWITIIWHWFRQINDAQVKVYMVSCLQWCLLYEHCVIHCRKQKRKYWANIYFKYEQWKITQYHCIYIYTYLCTILHIFWGT